MLVFAIRCWTPAAISALLFCSGGVSSGLGILLVIPVGAMSLLAEGRAIWGCRDRSARPADAADFSVVAGNAQTYDYSLAGMLGAVVFLVALMAWPVSSRLRESEALVRRQELDLANLAQLSQYIVQHLRESILVVDPSDRIRLINESARAVLGDSVAVPGALLGEVCAATAVSAVDLAAQRQRDTARQMPALSWLPTARASSGRISRRSAAANRRRSSCSSRTPAILRPRCSRPSWRRSVDCRPASRMRSAIQWAP